MESRKFAVSVYLFVTILACVMAWIFGRMSVQLTTTPPATLAQISRQQSNELYAGTSSVRSAPPIQAPTMPLVAAGGVALTNEFVIKEMLRQRVLARIMPPFTEREARSYVPKFKELGLSEEQAQERMKALERLHIKSYDANNALIEFAMARLEYDREIRQMLGADGYTAYRRFEEEKPARNELDFIKSYLGQDAGKASAHEAALVNAITDSKAFASAPSHGAYGPYPNPLVDQQEIISVLKGENERWSAGGRGVIENLRGVADAELIAALERYYQSRIDHNNAVIAARASISPEEELLKLQQQNASGKQGP